MMKTKITGMLIAALLLSTLSYAQSNVRVIPSPWAFSWGVGLGTMIPTGQLGENFKAGFAADTEISVYYQKAFLMINGGFSPSTLSSDIRVVEENNNESSWPAGSGSMHAYVAANLGVKIFEEDNISIYPFTGIGYGFIEPNLKTSNSDPLLSNLKINSFIWNAGFGIDYHFPDKDYAPEKINRILKTGVRYQFQKPNYEKSSDNLNGATHWFTLRFVIGSTMPGKVIHY